MKIQLTCLLFAIVSLTSTISATYINGRFVIVGQENAKVSVLLQFNTNTGIDDLGGATIVVGFDNTLIDIPGNPQRNVDYYFHNFSGGVYSLGTVTKPSASMVWVNIDLNYTQNNNGTIIAQNPDWTDVITINFELINESDSISLQWLTSSTFWGIYDGNNSNLWSTGSFTNFIGKINFDTTSPTLLDAELLDLSTLELSFSEPLDSLSAINESNYSISNGIIIQDAFLSTYKDVVTLITNDHTPGGMYTITAQNIYDLSGNLISSENNSFEYSCVNDTTALILTDVLVLNSRTINVDFSERVDYNTASNKNNYSISNNIGINSVQILPDSSGAVLKTSRQSDNTEYILTVSNIKDKNGNNISPNPSSKNYFTPNKGKGNHNRNTIQKAVSNTWHQYYTPEKTIDGKGMIFPYSRWQSEEDMPTAMTYDLGEQHSFDSLRISFYKWESGRMFEFSVYTSKDSVNWEPAIENIWSENEEWTELSLDSIRTRYMKLLLQKSNQGAFASIWEVEMFGTDTATSIMPTYQIVENFELSQNYPNPFNPSTKIRYSIPSNVELQNSKVTIKVYDILGNEIATLVDANKEPGTYEVVFASTNLASGIYIYQLKSADFISTKKMMLLR